jgi:hypothetical protein
LIGKRDIAEQELITKGSKVNSQSSVSSAFSSTTSIPPKDVQTKTSELVAINEKVSLTKEQNEVLRMICNSYEMTFSEYMQQAIVESMRFDIEEGNFTDVLLEKLGIETRKKEHDSNQPNTLKGMLDKLHGSHIP